MGDRIGVQLLVREIYLSLTNHPGQLSLTIPPWVGAMSTSQRVVMLYDWGVKADMVLFAVWSISERVRGVCAKTRYTNRRLLYYFTLSMTTLITNKDMIMMLAPAHTQRRMARLSAPGQLVTYQNKFSQQKINPRPVFRKIWRQPHANLRIFVQYTLILRQIYDNRANTLNIVNITKYINVNIKKSFIYAILRNHRQVCNAM